MKIYLTALLVPFMMGSALAAPSFKVLSIGDGDTLRLTSEDGIKTVRLACIDAPERAQVPYGEKSRKALQGLLPLGSTVGIRPITTDRYGREIAEVFVGARNINLQMVASGDAFIYRAFLKNCDKASYQQAENSAKAKKLGVWSTLGGIVKPWDWRHSSNKKSRYSCKSLSKEEALQLYGQGHTYLDKNNDGIPCNNRNND